jgi:hypothetical protein
MAEDMEPTTLVTSEGTTKGYAFERFEIHLSHQDLTENQTKIENGLINFYKI